MSVRLEAESAEKGIVSSSPLQAAGLSNGVNLSPQHYNRFESFPFNGGSIAANDYLPSLIHIA